MLNSISLMAKTCTPIRTQKPAFRSAEPDKKHSDTIKNYVMYNFISGENAINALDNINPIEAFKLGRELQHDISESESRPNQARKLSALFLSSARDSETKKKINTVNSFVVDNWANSDEAYEALKGLDGRNALKLGAVIQERIQTAENGSSIRARASELSAMQD